MYERSNHLFVCYYKLTYYDLSYINAVKLN